MRSSGPHYAAQVRRLAGGLARMLVCRRLSRTPMSSNVSLRCCGGTAVISDMGDRAERPPLDVSDGHPDDYTNPEINSSRSSSWPTRTVGGNLNMLPVEYVLRYAAQGRVMLPLEHATNVPHR